MVRHFPLHCRCYQDMRSEMIVEAQDRYGDMSYMLRGRSRNRRPDGSWVGGSTAKWRRNLKIVRAVIGYAMATGRLDTAQGSREEARGDGS